ncbi:hypothetical protein [Cupriavidus sp. YAF13]|uniref:hypothetical protein n=1 Tax=Cupriavidus sp. YAF13 TaxID=3233075 RepID=UPI003F905910
METVMKKLLVAFVLLCVLPAYACRPAFLTHEPIFERGAAKLSAPEIARLAAWRSDTRQAFPAGFEVFMSLWQNESAGISRKLAEARARWLADLLERMDVNGADIHQPEIRDIDNRHVSTGDAVTFLNTVTIAVNPRCPHACCDKASR